MSRIAQIIYEVGYFSETWQDTRSKKRFMNKVEWFWSSLIIYSNGQDRRRHQFIAAGFHL